MNLSYKPKERRVVPNWRYYEDTLFAGELNNWKLARRSKDTFSIDNYVYLWKDHQSLFRAGDLLSAAITNSRVDLDEVKEAASFILDKKDRSTNSLICSAKKVLGIEADGQNSSKIEIDRLRDCTATESIRNYIHTVRQRLHLMPYSPFLYVDLSRAYLLIGQTRKAEEAINQALHFGATDRFVARSAARFFLHLQDKDKAYDVIRAKGAVAVDPWLMAAEISINMLRGKSSNYVKKGREIIDSGNCTPFGFTELASSIGTLELTAGANRNSNKLFRKALIDPNDNSLAQVRWVNSFEPLSLNLNVNVPNDYEVKTYEALRSGDLNQARHEAVSWICDMPFAHKPINVGYSICTTLLEDFALASAILDVGLRSDETSPFLLNNKAYCSARAGRIKEAQDAVAKLKASNRLDESDSWKVCIPATEGIVLYRNNQLEEGAAKYKEAISIAKQIAEKGQGDSLYKKASLNYCRERMIAGDANPDSVLAEAYSIVKSDEDKELMLLINEITDEYNRKKL